jgi:hypothetical protein
MFDKFREECGVFGIFGHPEAANLTYLGLYALQHRGQESAGIASSDGVQIRVSKAMGYVHDVFNGDTLARLPGRSAVGHVRYSTAGESRLANAQPIVVDSAHGQLALCHNGNLVNADQVRTSLVKDGAIFQASSDSEVIVHLYARSRGPEQLSKDLPLARHVSKRNFSAAGMTGANQADPRVPHQAERQEFPHLKADHANRHGRLEDGILRVAQGEPVGLRRDQAPDVQPAAPRLDARDPPQQPPLVPLHRGRDQRQLMAIMPVELPARSLEQTPAGA